MKNNKILVILPAFNEEKKIGWMVKRSLKHADEVLVVDDCSTDKTAETAKSFGASVITHAINRGVGAGIKTGLAYALENGFDIIVIMGADKQDDPYEMPKLIAKLQEGYDFIQGSRYLEEDSRNYPKFRLITTKMYTKFISLYCWKKVTDASNGYRAITSQFVRSLDLNRKGTDRYEFETYFLLHALRYTRYNEVPVKKYYPLSLGYSKMKPFVAWYQMFQPIVKDLFVYKRRG